MGTNFTVRCLGRETLKIGGALDLLAVKIFLVVDSSCGTSKASPTLRLEGRVDTRVAGATCRFTHQLVLACDNYLIALMKRNSHGRSAFLLGRSESCAHPAVSTVNVSLKGCVRWRIEQQAQHLGSVTRFLTLDSMGSWKSSRGCDAAHTRGPAILEMQGLLAKHLYISRCGKKYKPK